MSCVDSPIDLPEHVLNEPSTVIGYGHLQRSAVVEAIFGRAQPKEGFVERTEDIFGVGDDVGYGNVPYSLSAAGREGTRRTLHPQIGGLMATLGYSE
jgi:hypothetical protein